MPEQGQEVIGYNPEWADEDFNPDGVCLCFYNEFHDEPYWSRSEWDNELDTWDCIEGEKAAPTHWMHKPKKPE